MKHFSLLVAGLLALAFAGCAPSASQLQKVIEENPDIVFSAIKKSPDKFIEVVNEAARNAQMKAQEKQADEEKVKRDAEFSNPLKPQIDEARVMEGKKDAPITIVEYSDFECPYCSRGYKTLNEVTANYKDKVRVIFKHLPLEFHQNAMPAARMFEALRVQGMDKAAKFYTEVFENQDKLRGGGEKFLKEMAKKTGADMKKFEVDLKSDAVTKIIEADMAEAKQFNFSGTPGFLVNGVSIRGAYPFSEFKKIIDRHLEKK